MIKRVAIPKSSPKKITKEPEPKVQTHTSFFMRDDGDCIVQEQPKPTLVCRKTLRPGSGRVVSGVTYEALLASGISRGIIEHNDRGLVSIRAQAYPARISRLG